MKCLGKQNPALVPTQFLCVLNIFLDGNRQMSKDAMTEFYHNLSMQGLR